MDNGRFHHVPALESRVGSRIFLFPCIFQPPYLMYNGGEGPESLCGLVSFVVLLSRSIDPIPFPSMQKIIAE